MYYRPWPNVTDCNNAPRPLDFPPHLCHTTYMKNEIAMPSVSTLATATRLDLALAEVRGEVTVKRLRTRGPRKGETWGQSNGGGRVVGAANGSNGVTTGNRAAAGGGQMTITGQCGQGKEMVANLDKVVANYKAVITAEHRADVRAAAAERRAAREAESFAALDALLDTL